MKQTTLTAILVAAALASCSTPNVQVSGEATDGQTIFLLKTDSRQPIDSTTAVNGQFTFFITPDETPCAMSVATKQGQQCKFVVEKTNVEVNLTDGSRKGGAINETLTNFDNEVSKFETRYKELSEASKKAATPEAKDSIANLFRDCDKEIKDFLTSAYAQHKGTFMGCLVLQELMYELTPSELSQAVDEHREFATNSAMGAPNQLLASYSKRAIGKEYTELEMPDTAGVTRQLSEWVGEGRYVLVDFWASWCGPCCREMPNVVANYEKYHAKGFEVVGVSFDKQHAAWTKAIDRLGLKWAHISDLKGWQSKGAEVYGIRSIPSNILIGPEGRIVASDLREEALGKKLQEIFGE